MANRTDRRPTSVENLFTVVPTDREPSRFSHSFVFEREGDVPLRFIVVGDELSWANVPASNYLDCVQALAEKALGRAVRLGARLS